LAALRLALPGLLLAVLLPVPHAAAAPANLVFNGSFERVAGGKPEGWAAYGAGLVQELRADQGRAGGKSARLACTAYVRTGSDSHAMLAQVGRITVKKGRTYLFSCWLKAEGIGGRQVSIALKDTTDWANCGLEVPVRLTREWKRMEARFRADRDLGDASRLQIWFAETGTLWVDDVQIVESEPVKAAFTNAVPATGSRNLVPNGSFEAGADGWSSLGESCGWGNLSGLFGAVVEGQGFDGGKCLRVELGPGKTPMTWFDYLDPCAIEQGSPLAANIGWIRLKPGAKYTLSAWMRADRPGVPAKLRVRQRDPGDWAQEDAKEVVLTAEWARYAVGFEARKEYCFIAAGPDLRRGGMDAATVLIDGIQLEEGRDPGPYAAHDELEVGLATGKYGNIYAPGEDVALAVTVHNGSARSAALNLKASGTDFFGRKLKSSAHKLEVPAKGTVDSSWRLPVGEKGVFDLVVSWAWKGRTSSRRVRLAVVEPYGGGDSPFGVNHAPVTPEWCALLRRGGLSWARDWTLRWQVVEPEEGRFDFRQADAQMGRLKRAGFRTLCLLPPFPSSNWASTAPADMDTSGYPGVRIRMAYAPRDPALLARFIGRTVERYRGDVHDWEFLNEPVYTDYSLPGEGQRLPGAAYTVKDYVGLLKVAAAAMKKADPGCRVIGGIGDGPDERTLEFVREGGLAFADALNLHTYPSKSPPESFIGPMKRLAEVMRAAGGVKPVWVTEYAYYAADQVPWTPYGAVSDRDWAGARLLADERECAAWSVRFATIMLSAGVERIIYHSGGSPEVNGDGLECAFLGIDGVPRKLYAAHAAMAGLLGPKPVFDRIIDGPDGFYGYAFQCGSRAVVVAWTDEDARPGLRLKRPPDGEAHDLAGNRLPSGPCALSGDPLYVVSPQMTAAELAGKCAPSGL